MFRDDIVAFLDDELIDGAIEHGRPFELAPLTGYAYVNYKVFVDASGGVGTDSYTTPLVWNLQGRHVVAHREHGSDPESNHRQHPNVCKHRKRGPVGNSLDDFLI